MRSSTGFAVPSRLMDYLMDSKLILDTRQEPEGTGGHKGQRGNLLLGRN